MTVKDIIALAGALGPLIVSIGGLLVAAFSLRVSWRGQRAALAVSEQQVELEQQKIRAGLFDRRYAAWLEIRDAADKHYQAVIAAQGVGTLDEIIPRELANVYRNASDKLYFLFNKDVSDAVKNVRDKLTALMVAYRRQHDAVGAAAQIAAQNATLDADQNAQFAREKMMATIKSHMHVAA